MGEAVSLSLSLGRLQVVSQLSHSHHFTPKHFLFNQPSMLVLQRVTGKNWCGTSPGSGTPGWSSPRREVCPSRTPTGHCEETWCLPAAGHSLARIGSLVPGSDLVLDRLWCRGRRPLGTATCVASSSLPICPTLPARRHRVVTCFIIHTTHKLTQPNALSVFINETKGHL